MLYDIPISEFRANHTKYIDMVARGDEIRLTSHGQPLARVVPEKITKTAQQILEEIDANRPPGFWNVTHEELEEMINAGRDDFEL